MNGDVYGNVNGATTTTTPKTGRAPRTKPMPRASDSRFPRFPVFLLDTLSAKAQLAADSHFWSLALHRVSAGCAAHSLLLAVSFSDFCTCCTQSIYNGYGICNGNCRRLSSTARRTIYPSMLIRSRAQRAINLVPRSCIPSC